VPGGRAARDRSSDSYALGALLHVQKLAPVGRGGVLLASPQEAVLRVVGPDGLIGVFCVHPGAG
jgi:hypothetical protein